MKCNSKGTIGIIINASITQGVRCTFFKQLNCLISAQNTTWVGLILRQNVSHGFVKLLTLHESLWKNFLRKKELHSFTFKLALTFLFYKRKMIHILQLLVWFVCIYSTDQISNLTHGRCRILDWKENNKQIPEAHLCGNKPPW